MERFCIQSLLQKFLSYSVNTKYSLVYSVEFMMDMGHKNKIDIKVRLHNYIILYAKRCSMTVSSGNETLTIDEGQIAFIERNIQINVSIKKSDSINPFVDYKTLTEIYY
ncbi:Virulence regulon transcriptional activator virF (plasmid) [Shigella dysenteriae WRSd3]|uniref:Virulence regulon transcriptional activator virF n=1 Tax=Shigella dysenteriae WRSd3 TaxID=1401327 RepID=A0A090N926_SHIDY|nr:Virulence regulon transcriptional activator virF [Shigella dysenteriae WRSd3]